MTRTTCDRGGPAGRPGRLAAAGLAALLLVAAACDDGVPGGGGDGVPGDAFAVVATSDYTVGALATVDLESWTVRDEVTAATGDTVVRVDGGLVIAINRYQVDSVRLYDPADLTLPLVEFSTGPGSNPQDAAVCGGHLVISRYGEEALEVVDPATGAEVGAVDLSAYADADGLPEAASMVRRGELLYVGLQRFDRGTWQPAEGGGRVVEVDCGTLEVTRDWETGPNPVVRAHPARDDRLLVLEGVFYDEDMAIALDGGIRELDLAAGELGPLELAEEELAANVVDIAGDPGGAAVLVTGDDAGYTVWCVDLGGWGASELLATGSYLPEMAVDDRGRVWITARTGWTDPGSPGGLIVVDAGSCADLTAAGWLRFSLDPFSVAIVPPA